MYREMRGIEGIVKRAQRALGRERVVTVRYLIADRLGACGEKGSSSQPSLRGITTAIKLYCISAESVRAKRVALFEL